MKNMPDVNFSREKGITIQEFLDIVNLNRSNRCKGAYCHRKRNGNRIYSVVKIDRIKPNRIYRALGYRRVHYSAKKK
jgi:hypothetical protein